MDKIIQISLAVGVCIYVIDKLFNLLGKAISKNKTAAESTSKTVSRDAILQTGVAVAGIGKFLEDRDESFFNMKTKIDAMDGIIGQTDTKRVPLVYNSALESSIDNLADSVKEQSQNTILQTDVIKGLMEHCKLKNRD